MNATTTNTEGGASIGGDVEIGRDFVGRDQVVINVNGYTVAELENVLPQLRAALRGGAELRADVQAERLTVAAPDAPRFVLSAADAEALWTVAARQADVSAYLTALLVNPRYGRWTTRFVPLAGALRAFERPPGWTDVTPEFRLLHVVGEGPGRQVRPIPLDDITQATAQHLALALLGEPGSGKTTTLYKLALDAAKARLANGVGRLPLYCPLAEYRAYATPYDFVAARLRQFTGADAATWLRQGDVLLLCDALNEMPFTDDRDYREKVAAWRRFVEEWPGNQVIFTCRSQDYSEPLGQHQVEIARLDDARVQDFLTKYDVGDAWERLRGTPLLELVRNPYYLSMLACLLVEGETWPESRASLFDNFVRVLLERERQKGHADWPGADALRDALAALADRMQPLGAGTRLPRAQVLTHLADDAPSAATALRLGLAATLLDVERVPDDEEHVRFYHHQVQEYFAAAALVERFRRGEDLGARWRQPRRRREMPAPGPLGDYEPLPPPPSTGWEEPTVLAAGLAPDPAGFIAAVGVVNPALAARCLSETGLAAPLDDLTRRVQADLLREMDNLKVHLRARLAAGEALGRLGDPRFPVVWVAERKVLLPPLVYVPAGPFTMGSTWGQVLALRLRNFPAGDERPRHTVDLPAFYIGQYPVTNAEYACFVDAGGYRDPACWRTPAAQAWLCGEEQESGALKELMNIWRSLKADLAPLARLRQAGQSPQAVNAWSQLLEMEEDEVRAVISQSYAERPRDRPAYWDDVRYNNPAQPVVGVTWFEAAAYCAWLEQRMQEAGGKIEVWQVSGAVSCILPPASFRVQLPSEAEWEKAARGTRGRVYPWGRRWDGDRANTWEGHVLRPSPVGVYPGDATVWGGRDFSGNVWEWTRSLYREYPYRPDDGREVLDVEGYRAGRGGSSVNDRRTARGGYRYRSFPDNFFYGNGFRVVLSLVASDS